MPYKEGEKNSGSHLRAWIMLKTATASKLIYTIVKIIMKGYLQS